MVQPTYNMTNPQNFWNKASLSDETKIELFGHDYKCCVSRGVNKAYDEIHHPAVFHGGGSLMF